MSQLSPPNPICFFVVNSLQKHLKCAQTIKDNGEIAGIISLKGYSDTKPVGTSFPKGLDVTTIHKLYGKYKFRGDATIVCYTEILRQYPFIVDPDEKFIGEGFVFSQIDQKYTLKVLPEILMIVEYLDDGYSKNVRKLTKKNPKGYARLKKQTVEYAETWMERYTQTILYMVGCRMSNQPQIQDAPYKILAILAYFPAWLTWKIFYEKV